MLPLIALSMKHQYTHNKHSQYILAIFLIVNHNHRTLEEISLDDHEVESFLEGRINNGRDNGNSQLDLPNRPTTVSRRTDEYMERGYDAAHPKGEKHITSSYITSSYITV